MRLLLLLLIFFQKTYNGSSSDPTREAMEAVRLMAIQRALQQATRQTAQGGLRGLPDRPDKTDQFDKVFEDVKCVGQDNTFTSGKVTGMNECKQQCIRNPACNFFAYWTIRKLCETYASCHERVPDGTNSIVVYKKLSACEEEISRGGMKYMERIRQAFPEGIIRPWGSENPNLYCRCTTGSWMLCAIFVRKDTPEDLATAAKLNRQNPTGMAPFYEFDMGSAFKPICFDDLHGAGFPSVIAEIQVIPVEQCLPIATCDASPNKMCPIRKVPFESGDPVYMLNRDWPKLQEGQPIECVSVGAMRTMYSQAEQQLHEGKSTDHLMLWLFSDADLATGICTQKFAKKRRGGGKKKKKPDTTDDSSEGGPSSVHSSLPGHSQMSSPNVMSDPQPSSLTRSSFSEGDLPALEAADRARSGEESPPKVVRPGSPVSPLSSSPVNSRAESPSPETAGRVPSNNPFSALDESPGSFVAPAAASPPKMRFQSISRTPELLPESTKAPTHAPTASSPGTELPPAPGDGDNLVLEQNESQSLLTEKDRMRRKEARRRKGIPKSFLSDSDEETPQQQPQASALSTSTSGWSVESWKSGNRGSPGSSTVRVRSPLQSGSPQEKSKLKEPTSFVEKEEHVQSQFSANISISHYLFLLTLTFFVFSFLFRHQRFNIGSQNLTIEFLNQET